MSEIWKQSIDPILEVSNLGRVRTIDRVVRCGPRPGVATRYSKLLKPTILSTGYAQVMGARRKKHSVHRLVAHAFIDGFEAGLVVNHKSGDRADNRVENLEWATHSENIRHSFTDLGRTGWCRGVTSGAHPTSKAVVATNILTGKETPFACALDAIRAGVGTDSGAISRCCSGESQHHNGHRFRFADDREASHAA